MLSEMVKNVGNSAVGVTCVASTVTYQVIQTHKQIKVAKGNL